MLAKKSEADERHAREDEIDAIVSPTTALCRHPRFSGVGVTVLLSQRRTATVKLNAGPGVVPKCGFLRDR